MKDNSMNNSRGSLYPHIKRGGGFPYFFYISYTKNKNDKKIINLWKFEKMGSIIQFVVSNQPDRVLTEALINR